MKKASLSPLRETRYRLGALSWDTAMWMLSFPLATVLRYDFDIQKVQWVPVFWASVFALSVYHISAHFLQLYRGRHVVGSLDELVAIAGAVAVSTAIMSAALFVLGVQAGVPRSAALIAAPIVLALSGSLRARWRISRRRDLLESNAGKRVAVYGAGFAAEGLISQLVNSPDSQYQPVVVLDDSPLKEKRSICGVPAGGPWQSLPGHVVRHRLSAVIVAIPSASSELLSRVYADASELGLEVIVLPALSEYLAGRTGTADLRRLDIQDLLGRQSVALDPEPIRMMIRGKRILLTGAGGSIGVELARQVAKFSPSSLTLVDRDETGLLATVTAVSSDGSGLSPETYLADIRDTEAVSELFLSRKPEVVLHAAALKHVSFLEAFPREAWKTNVEGTLNVLAASAEVGVSIFANISSDKAANPLNFLGRSKKLAEQLTAWFGVTSNKPYISVRFGNVLGSRGSLVPLVADQIDSGGPVKITDKKTTRYFMSASEACQLVLQAAAGGVQGDVMVLDMGQPVKIVEIAEKMIALSGKDVSIEYVGLREGEKLHEDLFSNDETPGPSFHPKIFRLTSSQLDPANLDSARWV